MASLSCGIIGLPNAGKSTLFNALTNAGAEVASYPFCTIDPNVGVVPVKDDRLDRIAELVGVSEILYQTVEYADVAGLVEGASRGEGRGNQFLDTIRNCEAIVHVVRAFSDPDVAHVQGQGDPVEDIRTVNIELILADLQTAERSLDRFSKQARKDPEAKRTVELLEKVRPHLDAGQPLRTLEIEPEHRERLRSLRFLSGKPVLYVANIDESALPGENDAATTAIRSFARREGNDVIPLCAKLESELSSLEADDEALFLEEMGLTEPGLQRLVRATRDILGLICFFTFNETQTRAWTVPAGTRAQDAAGVIHTDFSEKFIRAEVTAFDDFSAAGGSKPAHEHGLTRTEGRDYTVQDGDVILFRIGP